MSDMIEGDMTPAQIYQFTRIAVKHLEWKCEKLQQEGETKPHQEMPSTYKARAPIDCNGRKKDDTQTFHDRNKPNTEDDKEVYKIAGDSAKQSDIFEAQNTIRKSLAQI